MGMMRSFSCWQAKRRAKVWRQNRKLHLPRAFQTCAIAIIAAIITAISVADIHAQATPGCATFEQLVRGASDGFADDKSDTNADTLWIEIGKAGLGAQQCAMALGEGGHRMLYCRWSFAYRAGEARSWVSRLDVKMQNCSHTTLEVTTDLPVNHPDTFLQRHYRFPGVEIAISAKDKAASAKSHVFISFRKR